MSDRDAGSSFAVGFLVGAVVGVAIGFLYAPKPGRETRALLREKAGDIADKTKEAAVEAKKRVGEKLGHKGDEE